MSVGQCQRKCELSDLRSDFGYRLINSPPAGCISIHFRLLTFYDHQPNVIIVTIILNRNVNL